jgi:hypothetical protein
LIRGAFVDAGGAVRAILLPRVITAGTKGNKLGKRRSRLDDI